MAVMGHVEPDLNGMKNIEPCCGALAGADVVACCHCVVLLCPPQIKARAKATGPSEKRGAYRTSLSDSRWLTTQAT